MSTGMNFTCISAFDATKDIIWSFSYKFESESGILGNCGFTTFLNFLSSQTKGGINSGLGYGPYDDGVDVYEGAEENFLAISFENAGTFALAKNGFSTGIPDPIFNSISVRKNNNFQHVDTKHVDFNIVSDKWQTLRFQLTNLGHTLNVFYCDENFNYNKIATFETSDIFYISQQLYVGMSFATPIDGSSDFKLRIKNFHFYGQAPNILPPVIEDQTEEEYLIFGNTVLLSTNIVGARPLSIEWYKDNVIINDEKNSFYYAYDIGTYKLKAYNSAGYCITKDILVKKVDLPEFLINLNSSYEIPTGKTNVVLTVSASGTPDVSYRWYKNNSLINGEKTNNLTAYELANYMAVAYSIYGEASSVVATIDTNLPTVLPTPISGAAPLTIFANASGSEPLTYQWKKNNIDIVGANFNYYYAEEEGFYNVTVSNSKGNTTSYNISSYIYPKIVTDLIPGTLGVTLQLSAVGSEPIIYKWYKDGLIIPGENNINYTPSVVGTYKATASNIVGMVSSLDAIIQNDAPVEILSFVGPSCLDDILPVDPRDNTFIVEFNRPVLLNNTKITNAFSDGDLSAINVNPLYPDVSGYAKKFNITTKKLRDSYSIIETVDSVMTPVNKLTLLRESKNGLPLGELTSGSLLSSIKLPFQINKMPKDNTKTDLISISKNSLIIINECSNITHYNPPYNPAHPIIFINTTSTGSGLYRLYKGHFNDSAIGKTFVIRWEGVQFKGDGKTMDSIDTIWEAVFYKNYPSRITIKADPVKWGGKGTTMLRGAKIGTVSKEFINLDSSTLAGKSFTIDSAHKVILPPNICHDVSGNTNITSSMPVIVPTCLI